MYQLNYYYTCMDEFQITLNIYFNDNIICIMVSAINLYYLILMMCDTD